MDKYEYNLKLEEIDRLVDQKDYVEAAALADGIDWRRVRNVRTLCLISEIYEAAGRLQDAKNILLKAYRRTPVGRTVLYQLVEITIGLHEYDQAMEYYNEYVQAAPHDNNRYILKYWIYRGRGSDTEELIAILEEYLSQEYTERWAYELAKLYQKAGKMQKCLATCDDLVLWFQSGKYVQKALELKKKYAQLTPKQQEIYDQKYIIPEEAEKEEPLAEEEAVITKVKSTDGEVLTESILAATEKEIAGQVAAQTNPELEAIETENDAHAVEEPPMQTEEQPEEALQPEAEVLPQEEAVEAEHISEEERSVALAKSMREIISGVVKEPEEEDLPAAAPAPRLQSPVPAASQVPEPAPRAGQLSIDDILLSMGEKGKAFSQARAMQEEKKEDNQSQEEKAAESQSREEKAAESQSQEEKAAEPQIPDKKLSEEMTSDEIMAEMMSMLAKEVSEEVASKEEDNTTELPEEKASEDPASIQESLREDLTESQKEALTYTNHPEKLLRNRHALPTYRTEPEITEVQPPEEMLAESMPEENADTLEEDLAAGRTIRVPSEEIADLHAKFGSQNLWQTEDPKEESGQSQVDGQTRNLQEEFLQVEETKSSPEEEELSDGPQEEEFTGKTEPEEPQIEDTEEPQIENTEELSEEAEPEQKISEALERGRVYSPDGPFIPLHLQSLFKGFTSVDGLEPQIAGAIIQALANQGERTSRSGNILLFGGHGSGKTTLATQIATAVAQDTGKQTLKLARIYAADLNRKDIAATIAKIAGGTLIIEEAGDLEASVIDQLTTAMEFRTDGLLVILEDEEKYLADLLMQHPRFTMKFTSEICLPVYTAEELAAFAQNYANGKDYVINEDGQEELIRRISEVAQNGEVVSVANVVEIVDQAIQNSNKLLRRMALGKKRYNENDYVILYAKDFH